MSTNIAQVSRTLIIKSPYHLWELLKDRDENWCTESKLIVFMYAFQNLANGCKCDRVNNIEKLKTHYLDIKDSTDSKNTLLSMYNCQSVIFDENDTLFYQLLDTI